MTLSAMGVDKTWTPPSGPLKISKKNKKLKNKY